MCFFFLFSQCDSGRIRADRVHFVEFHWIEHSNVFAQSQINCHCQQSPFFSSAMGTALTATATTITMTTTLHIKSVHFYCYCDKKPFFSHFHFEASTVANQFCYILFEWHLKTQCKLSGYSFAERMYAKSQEALPSSTTAAANKTLTNGVPAKVKMEIWPTQSGACETHAFVIDDVFKYILVYIFAGIYCFKPPAKKKRNRAHVL